MAAKKAAKKFTNSARAEEGSCQTQGRAQEGRQLEVALVARRVAELTR